MEWKIENALSRDIERQQLNKILKEIRSSVDEAVKISAANANADIKAVVGQMFTGNTEVGVSAVYNAIKKVIDLSVPNFFIRLQGDVEGTGQVSALGDVTIVTALADGVGGIEEAPVDGTAYWRNTGTWEGVPSIVSSLSSLNTTGLLAYTSAGTIEARTLQIGDGITILNPAGDAGNPEISFNADTGEVAFIPGATHRTVQKFVDVMHSPGIITGGELSDIGSGSVRVSAGTMMIRSIDDDIATMPFADFAQTDFVVPDDQFTRFFGVVYNSGAPIVEMRSTFNWNKDTEIPLGSAVRLSSTITVVTNNKYRTGDPITNIIQRFDAVGPTQRDSSVGGLALGETGTRNVTVSAGRIWARLSDFDITSKNSSVDTMLSAYFNGTNLTVASGLTQWDNTQYNDMGTGTLVTVGNNKYANLWFFMSFDGTEYGFAYGIAEYNTLGDAANEGVPPYLTQNFFNQALLLGRFIFQKSAGTASIIESAFVTPFSAAAINTHNNLGGLQGGALNEFYHLTAAEYAALQAGYQPLDATLTALAGANWSANAIPIGTGADTVAQVSFAANTFPARASTGNLAAQPITEFGLSLIDDANAVAARTTLGIPTLAGGTYTPTLTNIANIDSSIASVCQFLRVDGVVTVSGRVDIDTTAAANTLTQLGISLPIASNFTAATQLGGAGGSSIAGSAVEAAILAGDATNDRATLQFGSAATTSRAFLFTFTYLVV